MFLWQVCGCGFRKYRTYKGVHIFHKIRTYIAKKAYIRKQCRILYCDHSRYFKQNVKNIVKMVLF